MNSPKATKPKARLPRYFMTRGARRDWAAEQKMLGGTIRGL